ncbi:MAG: hypothetical protein HOQ22_09600 [Nocardioidaceae bacterium]|nr:hypothetical protein [Nocardioidaceae bacterium]NUS51276.1 hypothetical protein [Nocardioidaceae bacterium]
MLRTVLPSVVVAQHGVATVAQLVGAGLTRDAVRAQVAARRWQRVGRHCVVTHNAGLSRQQWAWVAVLDHPGRVALGGMTGLEIRGFRFFGDQMDKLHVVVTRGTTYHRFPPVKIHESRRLTELDVVRHEGLPCTRPARSALDAAAWQPSRLYAVALLAAVVQQKLCSGQELADELRYVGRVRHKQPMRLAVADIIGGAEALSEVDVAELCRRFDLAPPWRQRVRRDRSGRRRYLDCEWVLAGGKVVVLEVDGSHHLLVESWERDMKRERGIVISGRHVLRCTASEARYEQPQLAADLRAMGVPTL